MKAALGFPMQCFKPLYVPLSLGNFGENGLDMGWYGLEQLLVFTRLTAIALVISLWN